MSTPLEKMRLQYKPCLPQILENTGVLETVVAESITAFPDSRELNLLFPTTFDQPILHFRQNFSKTSLPLRIGVVFSGGQAPGGHSVIAGIFDAISKMHPQSSLFGFINGPLGIITNEYKRITREMLLGYRNTGGFDLLGSGRAKIEGDDQFQAIRKVVEELQLDGLVIIGGDDSNTNAAILAEYFKANHCVTKVVGVPKTIDGDLKNNYIETSFGFDTACKTYSELIGNIARDAQSSKKYYHFIKLMGRSASHVTLECALQTCPNFTWIGEEVAKERITLQQMIRIMTDLICERAERGKNYGIFLIPEGLIEFIPEMKSLISELNLLFAKSKGKRVEALTSVDTLTSRAKGVFTHLPSEIQEQLLLDRDSYGNINVSHIQTEKLLIHMVSNELKKRAHEKIRFHAVSHFFGYEGRSAYPSNFDANYCYSLGHVAVALIATGHTGYMCGLQNLGFPVEKWLPMALPLTSMMHLEERKGKLTPVIRKTLVDLLDEPFASFAEARNSWRVEDHYRYPGPLQFEGGKELSDAITMTLEKTKKAVMIH